MLLYPFCLAYGEGHFGSTATGVFGGLVALVGGCVALVAYAYKTYPEGQK